MIKPTLYLRDKFGRFKEKTSNINLWKIDAALFVIAGALAMITYGLNTWNSKDRVIQQPFVLLTNQDGWILQLSKPRPVLVSTEKKPIEIISPLSKDILQPIDDDKLDPIEHIILDVFGAENFQVARAIAKNENGYHMHGNKWTPEWVGGNSNGSVDVGIFSINSVHFGKKGCALRDLLEPEKNIKCAYQIWDGADGTLGDGKGSWSPWVVFNTGTFKNYL